MKIIMVVAQNTVKEVLRDRVLYGLIIFAFLTVLMSLLLGELSFAEQARIITDFGLAASQLGCGMLSVFVGSSLVWREIEKQTVLTLLSKPVKRSRFIFGKFLGLGVVILLVDLIISAFLALILVNFGAVNWPQFVVAELGIFAESLFLLAAALFFGVFCRPVLTTLFTLSVWVVGHGINDLHYFSEKSQNPIVKNLGLAVARVFPNLEYLNFKESVIYGDLLTSESFFRAGGLFVAWLAILLVASVWIFDRRDFI